MIVIYVDYVFTLYVYEVKCSSKDIYYVNSKRETELTANRILSKGVISLADQS